MQFDKIRLEKNKGAIKSMLDELPDDFKESKGGGGSFLSACMDKDGEQWTGLQAIVEELFLLGIAIGAVRLVLPRKMWGMLPGGMPYYVIIDR